MSSLNQEQNQAVIDTTINFTRAGMTVCLVLPGEDGEQLDGHDFPPGSKVDAIARFVAENPNAIPILFPKDNGLAALCLTGERWQEALAQISHNDIPQTFAVRDGDEIDLLFSIPHGMSPNGFNESDFTLFDGEVTLSYVYDTRGVSLMNSADPESGSSLIEEEFCDDPLEIADMPSWMIATMDRGPLMFADVGVDRPENPTTEDLERIGFIFNEVGKRTGFDANSFVREITEKVKLMRSVGDEYYTYSNGVWSKVDDIVLDGFFRSLLNAYEPNSWTPAIGTKIRKTLKLAVPIFDPSDEPRWGINMENGNLDLETFQMRAHHHRYKSTVRVPVDFDESADCPRTRQFLDEILLSDEKGIATLQEFMGYCLTGETRAEKALALIGPGANGKSVFLRLLRALCGPMNVSSVSLSSLQGRFSSFSLVGKLVNISAENELRGSLNTELFKLIVSGEPLQVEKKFKQSFAFSPYCKLVLAMNSLPHTDDTTAGFSRRLLIVPCRRIFTPQEADRHLIDKLLVELPGVLNFALAGLRRLRENDYVFTESPVSLDAWKEYRMMLNPYLAFAEACVIHTPTARAFRQDLKTAFAKWGRANGHSGLAGEEPRRMFAGIRDALAEMGIPFREKISNGNRYFENVEIVGERAEKRSLTVEDDDEE